MKKETKYFFIGLFLFLLIASLLMFFGSKISKFKQTTTQNTTTTTIPKTYLKEEMLRLSPQQELNLFFIKNDYHCSNIEVETNECIIKTSQGYKNNCNEMKFTKLRCY